MQAIYLQDFPLKARPARADAPPASSEFEATLMDYLSELLHSAD